MCNKRILDGIKLIVWNCQSILNKLAEFKAYVILHSPEIVLISETYLKPEKSFSVPNYLIYRNDRTQKMGGGVAILIKKEIAHYPLTKSADNEIIEYIGIQIPSKSGKLFNIYSAYIPPSSPFPEKQINSLIQNNNTTIIAGDLNAKNTAWNCVSTNSRGQKLKNFCDNNNLLILAPSEHTHFTTNPISSDILDIVLTKKLNNRCSIFAETALSSDHLPVHLEIGGSDWFELAPPTSKVKWNIYQSVINETLSPSPIYHSSQIEQEIIKLESSIKNAKNKSTTFIQTHKSSNLPTHIRELIKQKNQAKKNYFSTLSPLDKNILNNLNNKLKNNINSHLNQIWEKKIENINDNNETPWNFIKSLKNKRAQATPLKNGNKTYISDKDKAEAFAEMLESQFTPNPDNNPTFTNSINNSNQNFFNHIPPTTIKLTNLLEIQNIIKNLNPKKAPGDDNISNNEIKNLPQIAILQITAICNAILRFQYYPPRWKKAKVILIPKPGKPLNNVNSYRPISLISNLSKIFEKIVLERLNLCIQKDYLIPEEQYGFVKGHSTIHQIARIVELILKNKNLSTPTGGIFLDIAKAFDRVWHEGLLYKLIKLKIPAYLIILINSYLSNRQFYCSVNQEYSSIKNILAGVPQGSILGPVLYNLFVQDIPKHNQTTILAMYADDTAILSGSRRVSAIITKLQNHLDKLSEWFSKWRIQINPDKSQAIIFTNHPIKHSPSSVLTLNNHNISWNNSVKYLGVTLDKKLNFTQHINNQIKKANRIKYQLYPIYSSKKLNPKIKLNIYKSFIRPILTYAAETWIQTSARNHLKLQRFQNIIIRRSLNAEWYHSNVALHKETGMQPIIEFIKKLTINTHLKMNSHPNPSVKRTLNYDPNPLHKFKRPKLALEELI